jgi:hypothetical protein
VIAETVVSVKSMTKWKTAKNRARYGVRQGDATRKTQKKRFYAVENLRTTIVSQTKNIIEFSQLELKFGVSGKADHRILRLPCFILKKTSSAN